MPSKPPLPPLAPGALPVVGHALALRVGSHALLRRAYKEVGPCFRMRVLHYPLVVVMGPESQQSFFAHTNAELRMDLAYSFFKPLFGNIAFTADPETFAAQRAVLQAPFRPANMPSYIAAMQHEVQTWLDSLEDRGSFDLVPSLDHLIREVALHAFLGPEWKEALGAELRVLYSIVSGNFNPLTAHWPSIRARRRAAARARLGELLAPILAQRLATPGVHDDLVEHLVQTAAETGQPLDEASLANYIIMFIFAAQESSAASASWALLELLRHDQHRSAVQTEIDANLAPGERLSPDVLKRMTFLNYCLLENERMHAVASFFMRRAAEEFQFGDYRIPKGWLVVLNAYVANRLTESFPEPNTFDPCRFSPERSAVERPLQRMVTFGGGKRMCPGRSFAHYAMIVLMSLLLQQFSLNPIHQEPKPVRGRGSTYPESVMIYYERRTAPSRPAASGPDAGTCPHHAGF